MKALDLGSLLSLASDATQLAGDHPVPSAPRTHSAVVTWLGRLEGLSIDQLLWLQAALPEGNSAQHRQVMDQLRRGVGAHLAVLERREEAVAGVHPVMASLASAKRVAKGSRLSRRWRVWKRRVEPDAKLGHVVVLASAVGLAGFLLVSSGAVSAARGAFRATGPHGIHVGDWVTMHTTKGALRVGAVKQVGDDWILLGSTRYSQDRIESVEVRCNH